MPVCYQRLEIAQEFQDHSAERRACTNLGNAHVFLCHFEAAAEYYRSGSWLFVLVSLLKLMLYSKTLLVALETKDRAVEAQVSHIYTHFEVV